jgi:hypothetical protein
MSASPVFSSAATGRPFIFSPPSSPPSSTAKKKTAEILAHVGGLARGCLTEICGTASSGRTSVLLLALARATQRGEVCALVDASDAFDPASAAAAGMEMSRLLWVRCGEKYPSRKRPSPARTGYGKMAHSYQGLSSYASYQRMPSGDSYQSMPSGIPQVAKNGSGFSRWEARLGQMLKVTDLLLQSNGFGMIALDLGDVPVPSARRIPLASWFRFRRAIEHTPTALLVLEQQPIAGSCSSILVKLSGARSQASGNPLSALSFQLSENRASNLELPHSELLDQFEITAELLRSRLERNSERKPVQSSASFKSRAAWTG